MRLKRTNRFLYKQLLSLRENIQNRKKVLKFKKKKWKMFVKNYKRKLKRKKRLNDLNQYLTYKIPRRHFSYKWRYKNTETEIKKLKFFYGKLNEKNIKKNLIKIWNKKYWQIHLKFLENLESRLDTVLYWAKFALSMKNATQLILQNKIYVNDSIVNSKSFRLTSGDIIRINKKYLNTIKNNIKCSIIKPGIPRYLNINYRTLQIIFGIFNEADLSQDFFYRINIEKILKSKYH